jgi:hypothetical protein
VFVLPHFTRAFLIRSVAAWVSLRISVAGISMLAAASAKRPPPEHPFVVTPETAVLVIAIVAVTGMVFSRLRNEDLFLSNLGYGPARMACLAALPPALLEISAGVVARV